MTKPTPILIPQGVQFGAPPPLPPGADLAALTSAVQRILDIMVENGYALKVRGVPP